MEFQPDESCLSINIGDIYVRIICLFKACSSTINTAHLEPLNFVDVGKVPINTLEGEKKNDSYADSPDEYPFPS